MTQWLAWGVLMLVTYSKASIFSNELDDKIKEGIKSITEIASAVEKEAEKVNRAMNKISLYLPRAVNESIIVGKKMYNGYAEEVDGIITVYFGKAIDSNSDTRVLLRILEKMENTKGELGRQHKYFEANLGQVLEKRSNELGKLRGLTNFTQTFSTGFFNGLKADANNCKDNECIAQLIHTAQTRRKSLTDIFDRYIREIQNINVGLDDGIQNCIGDARKGFGSVLVKFEYDMKYILENKGRGFNGPYL